MIRQTVRLDGARSRYEGAAGPAQSKVQGIVPGPPGFYLSAEPEPGHWARPEWERLRRQLQQQGDELRRSSEPSSL
jgi:hypothetical protein